MGYFQAYAFFDSYPSDSCALESVAKEKPFQFRNDNEVLAISTRYLYNPPTPMQNCKWFFTGPEGYGFKIVFAEPLNITSSAILTVINSTDDLITK